MKIQMFGDVDYNPKGQIKSVYPAWWFETLIEELTDSVDEKTRALRDNTVPQEVLNDTKALLAKQSARLDEIIASKPKLGAGEKDRLKSIYSQVGNCISEAMFTRSDMQRGLTEPREEVRRLTNPVINLGKIEHACEIALSCNVPVTKDKKITRKGAEKMFKIIGKHIGEPTNTEVLRRDGDTNPLLGV